MAFSRSLVLRNLLEEQGIARDRIHLKANVSQKPPQGHEKKPSEYILLTIRRD